MVGALAALGLAAALLGVDGDTTCPSPAQVRSELARLAEVDADQPVDAKVVLSPIVGGVRVELLDGRGTLLAARRLEATLACPEMAAAVAVVIASWTARLRSGVDLRLELEPPAPPAPPRAPIAIEPLQVQARPTQPARSTLAYDVGAGVTALVGPGGTVPAGFLEATLAPARSRFGARLALVIAGLKDEILSGDTQGHISWNRSELALGPRARWSRSPWVLDLHAEAVVGIVFAEGVNYVRTEGHFGLDLGLGTGFRIGYDMGALMPFAGIALAGWLRPQEVTVTNVAGRFDLPRIEGLFSAGIAFGQR